MKKQTFKQVFKPVSQDAPSGPRMRGCALFSCPKGQKFIFFGVSFPTPQMTILWDGGDPTYNPKSLVFMLIISSKQVLKYPKNNIYSHLSCPSTFYLLEIITFYRLLILLGYFSCAPRVLLVCALFCFAHAFCSQPCHCQLLIFGIQFIQWKFIKAGLL